MPGLMIEEAKYLEDVNFRPLHSHNCYEILYVKDGHLSVTIGSRCYEAIGPSLVFISKLEQHALRVKGSAYKRYYLCISPFLAGNLIRDYSLLTVFSSRPESFCHVLDVTPLEAEMDRIFSACVFEYENVLPYSAQRQASLISEMLVLIYRYAPSLFASENNKSISVIWKIQCRLEQDCQEEFTLEELAKEYHISTSYLSHLFKKVTGYSVMQYLTMCRLSLARQLLEETELSVTEILFRTGFSDSSNFARLFKREMQISPMEYRKKQHI